MYSWEGTNIHVKYKDKPESLPAVADRRVNTQSDKLFPGETRNKLLLPPLECLPGDTNL